ncbi:hypothetical protein FVEG_14650 [Fusarium verticillioides 7600]|uniref:Uncharacterized protein n=1 Tax=Gibberella moniliformis (strain M3125 / FGSC 7600) TaxID=334819 RepID=W7LUP4_GIBM7|nr:hypothetical protein FVEG_14650 [Fusarium verticillioides 7600]EWG36292.1 hypothetical protein FVEG_14650 [Fusarium verticillioides 7600]
MRLPSLWHEILLVCIVGGFSGRKRPRFALFWNKIVSEDQGALLMSMRIEYLSHAQGYVAESLQTIPRRLRRCGRSYSSLTAPQRCSVMCQQITSLTGSCLNSQGRYELLGVPTV